MITVTCMMHVASVSVWPTWLRSIIISASVSASPIRTPGSASVVPMLELSQLGSEERFVPNKSLLFSSKMLHFVC